MSELQQLYELQELDIQIDELKESLAATEAELADDSVAAEARRRVAALETHAERLAANRRSLDRTIEDLQTRLGRTQERMYSGAITSVKEMEAAEDERASTEQAIAENEDRLLEIMVSVDEVDGTLEKGREVVLRLEEQRAATVETLSKKAEELRSSLDELTPRREDMRGAIPAPSLHRYDTLRSNRGGTAIAKVERGLCSTCRMALSTSELQRIRSTDTPMQCGSCHRILYLV